ncbi:MAG: peptide deformylase [Chloroflexota bacterium]|nr:peptide deformylase [Chloroflexota bacterium]
MALLTVLTDENPRLRLKSQKITKFDKALRELAVNMLETMDDSNGIGLAAPQVGVLKRLIVIHIPADLAFEGSPEFSAVVVNPEVVKGSGEQIGEEGCLSVPGWFGEVKRYFAVTVRGRDIYGKEIRIKADGWPSRCLQHEIDHLDGIIFTDKITDPSTLHKVEPKEEAAEEELAKVN